MFSNSNVAFATKKDAPLIVILLNLAYRGNTSKQGWTTEAHLIAGEVRTTVEQVHDVLATTGSVFLLYKQNGTVVGCVNLQIKSTRVYLGMFAVQPDLQGGGIGKQMLQAAQEWALFNNCNSIYMIVISVRTELIDWYKRHGYVLTGNEYPFEEDGISGAHLHTLRFVELEKSLH